MIIITSRFLAYIKATLFVGKMSKQQAEGIATLASAYAAAGGVNIHHLAYILATAYYETARTMQPVIEAGGNEYLRKNYDITGNSPNRARKMGNLIAGNGVKYCGRGYVQLTWKNNYKRAGDMVSEDLVSHPELALDTGIAAKIAVNGMISGLFTGKRLGDYNKRLGFDYANARRIINGLDKAIEIAGYARRFYDGLLLK